MKVGSNGLNSFISILSYRKKNNERKQKNVDVINNYDNVNEQRIEIDRCQLVI